VPFAHHQEVASLPPAEADFILTKAESGELKRPQVREQVRQVQREIRAAAPKPEPDPSRIPPTVRIEWGDARAMPLDRDTVDLIVTSPPYALDKPYSGGGDVDPTDWRRFIHAALVDMLRVTKPHGRLALNVPLDVSKPQARPIYSSAVQMAMAAGWKYRSTIVWDDTTLGKSTARGSMDSASAPNIYSGAQMIALFSNGEWAREAPGPSDLQREEWLAWTNGSWRFPGETKPWEDHPAAFPLGLPHRLIKLLSFPGDVVLDPFSGSGTTCLAAVQLGRQAIGFDRSEAYVASALRRIAAKVDRAGPCAVGTASAGEGLPGPGAAEVLEGGLRGRLDSSAGGDPEPERVPAGQADLDEDDDYPRESDVYCSRCDGPIMLLSPEQDRQLGKAVGLIRDGAPLAIFCLPCAEPAEVSADEGEAE
jgi:site-specific DNA-methyltransferase (adenine-specific)